jgi:hypothetical protein
MIKKSDESGDGPRRSPTDRDIRRIDAITSSIVDAHLERMASLEGRDEAEAKAEWLSWLVALTQALVAVYTLGTIGRIEDPNKRAIAEIRMEIATALMESVEARRDVLEAGLVEDPGNGPAGHAEGRVHRGRALTGRAGRFGAV